MPTISDFQIPPSVSISEQVHDAIRRAIITKTLEPGSPVAEAQLAELLGVSKTPIREAFLRLREVGLLVPQHPRGLKVVAPTEERITEALEIRNTLECAAARYAAHRADPNEIENIMAAAKYSLTAARMVDVEGFRSADQTFHQRVWNASRNMTLAKLADNAYALASALREMRTSVPGHSEQCALQHVQIAEAISDRKPEAAERLMKEHIEKVYNTSIEM